MKTKQYLVVGILGIALAGFILSGCKKKSSPPTDSDVTASQDEANASFVVNDTKTISDGAATNQKPERMENGGPCAVITHRDTNNHADSLLDIYFPGSCVSPDGRTRSGHILVSYLPGHYFTQGDTIQMSFKNYSVKLLNGFTVGVTGTRTLINIGKDSLGDHSWSFTANLTLTYSNNGGVATWTSSRTNTLQKISGIWYYEITGSASGVTRNGVSFSINITSPLYRTAWWINSPVNRCDCFEAGELTITRSNKQYPLDLKFTSGIGNCGHTATATINNKTYNITLP